jgi:outer membrane lipoprotein-sorting protein
VIYGRYVDFGDHKYPSTVTIKRPLDHYQVVLTVEKVTENMPLSDDQFQIKIPEGTKIQNLE